MWTHVLGGLVTTVSLLAFDVRFNPAAETEAKVEFEAAIQKRLRTKKQAEPAAELEPALSA